MSREHAVAERPAPASTARETRLPVREPSHDAPERGATTRDWLAAALVGEEHAWETTRERVATAVAAEPTTPAPERAEAPRRARRTTYRPPTVPTHPAPSHPKGRLTVDRPHGPARTRAPPRVFTKLHVTDPADAWESHADAVAALVLRDQGRHHEHPTPPSGTPAGPGAVTTERAQTAVEEALAGTGGAALPDAVRSRVEPVLHADLSRVQVRQDAATIAAARALGARAFTVGRTIHLGPGASTHDLGLMAHEATHVVHQGLAPARAPPVVMRSVSDYLPDVSVTDVIPDSVLDGVRTLVRAIPGYTALTYVVGQDLLTGEPVHVDVDALLDAVLTRGPFGPAVATVLRALSIAQDIYAAVTAAFAAHDLTLARFGRDIKAAWAELSITKGIDGNVAVVRRYIDAILTDLRALVTDLVDQVLALVRRAVVAVAEPFLQRPSVAPVWNLAKEVLHYDPLRGVAVDVPTVQIIADFLTLIGQTERLEQMRQRGTLQETADWLDTQLATFRGILTDVGALFSEAWDAIQPANLPNLLDTLPALADRAVGVVQRIADFGLTLIVKVLELVKKALLGWLSEHAHQVPGFHMLTVIIGQNPFTGEVVPRTPANLIKGFITLLPNGEATYDELEKSGVVTEAAGRIEAAMVRLGISLDMVVATFRGVWDALSLDDLLQPIAAFQRVVAQFGEPLARIIEFVGVVLQVVVELILRLMNFPTELLQHVITNAMQAIEDIRRDPVAFLRNVMAALKLGFSNFFDHIGGYLLDGLVAWLFRGLGQLGIHLPTDFSLKSIIGLVLDVLGLSIEHLWDKLGEHIGKDKVALIRRAIDTIGGAWQFIADVQREGLPAIWRYVEGQLSNLWQMLLDAALSWITRIVVQQAVTKLLSFLDPTGIMAVINSAIAIFNAIQSAIEYLRDLLEVLDRYVSTLAAVAAGNVVPGAQMLEQGLAAIIPIAIGFLANQVGLGNIPEKIVEIVGGIRHLVDEALDWLIEQALRLGRAALDALGLGPKKPAADPTNHTAVADEVAAALSQPGTGNDYATDRAEKEAQAKGFEGQYAGRLGPGVGLKVIFQPPASDASDNEIDFEVVIAPNDKKKKGKSPTPTSVTFAGGTLTVNGDKTFTVGSRIQVAKGGGWYRDARVITAIAERDVGGVKAVFITFDTEPPGDSGTIMARSYPIQWRAPIASLEELSAADLAVYNAYAESKAWPSDVVAKKVLNYRAIGIQTNNPPGQQWEHIVEASTGGPNSADNLALAEGTLNRRLGTYYGEVRRYPQLAIVDITDPIILRDYLRGKSASEQRKWKLWVYASPDFRVALAWQNSPRGGRYQTLS
jgi:hypothetical protein